MEQKNEKNVFIEKKIFIFSIFVLATLIISTIMLSYFLLNDKILKINEKNITNEPDLPVYENTDDNDVEIDEQVTYMLKEYNGKIGVYENAALIYTLDTYVFTLPDIDKQLLREGIITASKTELYELIEEYY